jgi:hypothetical protein
MTTQPHTAKAANPIDKLIAVLEPYFTKKAPLQIPENGRKAIVEYGWIISLILGILLVPAVFVLIGLMGAVGAIATAAGVHVGPTYWLAGLALVVQMIFLFVAVPGLKNRSYTRGWKVVFYSQLFSAAGSILHLNLGSLVGAAIGLIIGFYLLFQIKSYYR